MVAGSARRMVPMISSENEYFWRGGAAGELRILRCQSCSRWLHPPLPGCPECRGRNLAPEPTSGRGTVFSFTINGHPYNPALQEPYVIAIVELVEQVGLRFTTNIVGCELDDVYIGQPVHVVFEEQEGVFYPLFSPSESELL